MKIKPVKTAVIGCGMISDIYLQNLKDTFSIIDLVGCSDIVDSKAKEQAEKYNIKKMTNDEILNNPEIEIVVNLTNASSHFEVNKQVMNAKKHLYCEKMMCDDMEQANELKKIKSNNNVRFSIAPDTILGGSVQSLRKAIECGIIGEPVFAVAYLSRGYHMIKEDKDDAIRKFSVMEKGGGIPYDMGSYYLHALFNIFGSVNRVCGFSKTHNQTRPYLNPRHSKFNEDFFVDTPNTICSSLEFKNGLYASLTMTSECFGGNNTFEIHGTEGILYCGDPNNFGDKIYVKRRDNEKLEFPLTHPYTENSRGIGVADMAWAIREERPQRLLFELGYHALEVITAINNCTNNNCVQLLDTDFEIPKPISSLYYGGTSNERNLFLY